jgi:hypothetical protein
MWNLIIELAWILIVTVDASRWLSALVKLVADAIGCAACLGARIE